MLDRAIDGASIAGSFFSVPEVQALETLLDAKRTERFIELWTLKESYLKATGAGLSHSLEDFGFEWIDPEQLVFTPPPHTDAAEWHFALYAPAPAYRLAVAARARNAPLFHVSAFANRGGVDAVPLICSPTLSRAK